MPTTFSVRRRSRLLFALSVALLVTLALAMPRDRVLAHASLLASDPAEDAVVPLPPSRVTLTFAEPVDTRLSSIEVTTTDGKRVDRDDFTPTDGGRRATVTLMPLARGTYIVGWKNVSTIDGHPLSGRFAFHIGARSTDAAIVNEPPIFASPLEPIARFLLDAGLRTLAGTLSVLAFVAWPARDGAPVFAGRTLRGLAWAAAGLALVGVALQLAAQADATGASPLDLFGGRWGAAYAVRVAAIAMTGGLVLLRRPRLALITVTIALASIPATSHGAAVRGLATPAIIVDALHLASVSVWVGGLPAILLVVWTQRDRRPEVAEALRRFSTLALIAAGVAGLTGTYLAWLHVLQLSAIASVYGRGVVMKFLLFGALLALGAANRRWSLPALVRGVHRRVRLTLMVEVMCGVGLVVAVAVMTSTLPAREELHAPLPGGISTTSDGTRIEVRVRPALPGVNEITIDVRDARGRAIDGAAVAIRAAPVGQTADEPIPATPAGNGDYRLSAVLGARGVWTVAASVAPPEGFDSNASFRIEVGGAPPPRPSPAVSLGWKAFGWILVVGGGFAAAVADREWQWRARSRSPWYGAAAAAIGLVVLLVIAPRYSVPTSLPSASPDTLALGKRLFEANCAKCHGTNFVPATEGAADLRVHVPVHPDAYLLDVVRHGRPGTAMPPFRDSLSETEIGAVLTYVREQAAALAVAAPASPSLLPTTTR